MPAADLLLHVPVAARIDLRVEARHKVPALGLAKLVLMKQVVCTSNEATID